MSKVSAELDIDPTDISPLSADQKNTLAEFITVLEEAQQVALTLEADKKVTMSRAPRLLRELY